MTHRSCSTSRPRKPSRPSSLLAAALFLGSAAPAVAGSEDFAPHVQKAQSCYDAKDFDCAVRELQAAYDIKQVPGLLLNIGHAHLDAGRPQEALTFYGLYLRSEKKLTPEIRAEVEKLREQARQKLRETATQPATPPAATPEPTETPPPAETPAAAPPAPAATPAQATPPPVETPPPAAAPSASKDTAAPSRPPAGGLALIGVGAGLFIIGLGLGGGALATASQVTADAGPFDTALDDRGRTLNSAGIALDVIGGLALVGGIGWTVGWAVNRRKEKAPAAVSIRPAGARSLVLGRY